MNHYSNNPNNNTDNTLLGLLNTPVPKLPRAISIDLAPQKKKKGNAAARNNAEGKWR